MDRDVSAKTIREVEFREKLRGYNQDDVDEFLERVAVGLEILHERLRQANERAVRAEQRSTEVGEGDEAMRRTLVLAQRTADLALDEARQQAAAIVSEAQAQAQAIAEDATRELRSEISKLEAKRDQLWSDVAVLGRYLQEERGRLRLAFGEVLRRLDDQFPSLAPVPNLTDGTGGTTGGASGGSTYEQYGSSAAGTGYEGASSEVTAGSGWPGSPHA